MTRALLLALGILVCSGCTSPLSGPPSRLSPAGTIAALKKSVRVRDYAEEWDILSPDLKAQISERVGRNVDFADYERERRARQGDVEIRCVEQKLRKAQVQTVRRHSPTRATAYLSGPLGLGGCAQIGLIRLDRWELRILGDPQPYDGVVGDPVTEAIREPDGSYTVVMRDDAGDETMRLTFPSDQVEAYEVLSKWYADDLGEIENDLFSAK